ncbi:ABC transporter substrate-binding protein [Roseiterribacter gracilis]|uniref:Peptide ABC transporter substrate-binding protein n=1 Tax=Roseiterribacter gracilis TaxID=2812848 RepID=A0A8S8XCA9_9PROT|nr:peptide ABC transporter substrate-binding protein [Rhodospirillales bacterium TMPK1]
MTATIRRRAFLHTSLAAAGLGVLPGSMARAHGTSTSLVIGRAIEATTIDPARTTRMSDFGSIALAYETLTSLRLADGVPTADLAPALAATCSSDDNVTWRFRLRAGARFANGSAVDADAVARSFARLFQADQGPAKALSFVRNVSARDGEVEITLTAALPAFPLLLSLPMFGIVDARASDDPSWFATNSAGSGPYRLSSWHRGTEQIFTAARDLPFDTVIFRTIRSSLSRVGELRQGDIDFAESLSPDEADLLAASPGVTIASGAGAALTYLEMNNQRAPFTDLRFRQAVDAALNREAMLAHLLRGHGRIPAGLLPAGDTASTRPRYDPHAAAALARAVGASLTLTLNYIPADALTDALAVTIQSNLGDAGIPVTLQPLSASSFGAKVRFAGDFDLALRDYTADFPDPWIVLDFLYASKNIGPSGNLSRYASPTVDALLDRAASSLDAAPRAALYRDAEAAILADTPHAVLFCRDALIAARSDLRGPMPSFWQPQIYPAAFLSRTLR